MPTAYKGKLRIACRAEVCVKDRTRADAEPDCFCCPDAACEVLDLDDRVILAVGVTYASDPEPMEEKNPETVADITKVRESAAEKGKKKR